MSLEHRHVDQAIKLQNLLADGDLHAAARTGPVRVALQVNQGNPEPARQLLEPAGPKSARCLVADPGALQDDQVAEPLVLEVGENAGHQVGVRRRAGLGLFGDHQVGLDADPGVLGQPDFRADLLEQIERHPAGVAAVDHEKILFIHARLRAGSNGSRAGRCSLPRPLSGNRP